MTYEGFIEGNISYKVIKFRKHYTTHPPDVTDMPVSIYKGNSKDEYYMRENRKSI